MTVHWLIEPGFFSSQPVHVALVIGGVVAVVSAIVGVFTVLRGQSFAGHALTDVSTAGGSGALLVGMNPLLGFVGFGLLGAGTMDVIGVQRVRGRDLATGVVLGAAATASAAAATCSGGASRGIVVARPACPSSESADVSATSALVPVASAS